MSFAPGTRLGPYEILAPIGAGGRGEVYRARDTKLKHDVALKVLPKLVTASAARPAREFVHVHQRAQSAGEWQIIAQVLAV